LIRQSHYQDAWVILAGGVIAIVIGLAMNWRNSATGYWINLTVVLLLDLPFVLFVLVPGLAPLWPGLQGPIAFAIAATLSGVALAMRPGGSAAPRQDPESARASQRAAH
jgi:hypothetical protein